MKQRIVAVAGGVAVLLLMVAGRIGQLMLNESPELSTLARRQQTERIEVAAQRGPILARDGETLASSVDRPSIYVRPRQVLDRARTEPVLAATLGLERQRVAAQLAATAPFVWLKRGASPRERDAVDALALPGVGALEEPRRFYPHGRMAAHVIGVAGVDMQGLEGIERRYERDLKALSGSREVERDAHGRPIFSDGMAGANPVHGASVQLTLDVALQAIAERALERGVTDSKAAAGTALVLDPWTGEILALANAPSFDPNDRSVPASARPRNRAVTDMYEPGSTFKALLAAAALEYGAVRPDEMFFCENGAFPVGKWVIHDHHGHGWLSVADIIQVSSNIGVSKIAERMGRDKFHGFLESFEFGRPTGVDLPGEVGGQMRGVRDWSRIVLMTTAYGQGIAVTPLQMARAFGAIANGGLLMQPYLGMRAVDADGRVLWEHGPTVVRRVMRPETAALVTGMLVRVTEQGGTGTKARIPGIQVAGKTGTAQKIEPGTGRYSPRGRIASFVGFVPADAPRYVILAVVDEPRTTTYGGLVAAPIFQEIATGALARLGLLPGTPPADLREARDETEPPVEPTAAAGGGVPSFLGLSKRAAMERARDLGWVVQVTGTGYVTRQEPAPGAGATPGQEVQLSLAPAGDAL